MDFETRNYRFDHKCVIFGKLFTVLWIDMLIYWQILENNLTSRIMVMINWDKAYEMSTTVPRS